MPKRVDADARRRTVADALLRVAARDGLEAVSLRHVAAEAGVTAGMLQHYFSSKDEMLAFAMHAASERYERRFTAALASLGEEPSPAEILRTVLRLLIPRDQAQRDDARVALAFQASAAGRRAAAQLAPGDEALRAFVTEQVSSCAPRLRRADSMAVALLATGEGLGVAVLTGQLGLDEADAAIEAQLALLAISPPPTAAPAAP